MKVFVLAVVLFAISSSIAKPTNNNKFFAYNGPTVFGPQPAAATGTTQPNSSGSGTAPTSGTAPATGTAPTSGTAPATGTAPTSGTAPTTGTTQPASPAAPAPAPAACTGFWCWAYTPQIPFGRPAAGNSAAARPTIQFTPLGSILFG